MARVGVVPEEPDAPAAMTARLLSRFCDHLYPSWDGKAVEDRLARFGVPMDIPFGRLSKGEKGRMMLAAALGHAPELLVLDDPTPGLDVVPQLIGELAGHGTTVFLATHDPPSVESLATHVGLLKDGRLLLDEEMETLKSRFRRIRYGNEITASRTAYGTELDAFDAVRVRARGWGVDAIVSNYDDRKFEQFRRTEGVVDAVAAALTLEEIFLAVAGEEPKRDGQELPARGGAA
jgi:ABC-2 type transport system ATP-binding protein